MCDYLKWITNRFGIFPKIYLTGLGTSPNISSIIFNTEVATYSAIILYSIIWTIDNEASLSEKITV